MKPLKRTLLNTESTQHPQNSLTFQYGMWSPFFHMTAICTHPVLKLQILINRSEALVGRPFEPTFPIRSRAESIMLRLTLL